MSTTTTERLENDGSWKKIAGSKQKGYFSNEGPSNILVREDSDLAVPETNDGHTLERSGDNGYYFSLRTGQAIYARNASTSAKSGKVVITVEA